MKTNIMMPLDPIQPPWLKHMKLKIGHEKLFTRQNVSATIDIEARAERSTERPLKCVTIGMFILVSGSEKKLVPATKNWTQCETRLLRRLNRKCSAKCGPLWCRLTSCSPLIAT